jgi:hypothetical protein
MQKKYAIKHSPIIFLAFSVNVACSIYLILILIKKKKKIKGKLSITSAENAERMLNNVSQCGTKKKH